MLGPWPMSDYEDEELRQQPAPRLASIIQAKPASSKLGSFAYFVQEPHHSELDLLFGLCLLPIL